MIDYKNSVFIDSYQIFSAPLANLVDKAKARVLKLMSELGYRKDRPSDRLKRKCIYQYEYIT